MFATCLVDQFFPDIGLATLSVLKKCGVDAEFPRGQTCCGQPFFNMGYRSEARRIARQMVQVFSGYDAIVMPSGSCASMLRVYYPDLFPPDDPDRGRAIAAAARTFELTQFLVQKLGIHRVDAEYNGTVTYHDGCHCLRELRVKDEPRALIRGVKGCTLVEMAGADACCGFGGTFSVKFSEISTAMVQDKADAIRATGAGALVSTDASCLMQITGYLKRKEIRVTPLHIAQLLAGRK